MKLLILLTALILALWPSNVLAFWDDGNTGRAPNILADVGFEEGLTDKGADDSARQQRAAPANPSWDNDTYVEYERSKTEWQSLFELGVFLALDDAPLVLVADAAGNVNFAGQCEDVAMQLRDRAWHRMETEILTPSEMRKYGYKKVTGDAHVICKVFIGNKVIFVEPSENLREPRTWEAYKLD